MATRILLLAAGALALVSCGKMTNETAAPASDFSYQEKLQTELLDAKPGDAIEIPAGTFSFNRSLSLNIDGVTIKGAGMDKTILSFKGQVAGAEGMLVTANDFTIEDLAIEDTKGDALKINEGNNIVIRRVRTEWTGEPKTSNGAYGVYPVRTTNVLIDGAVSIGASDAGIYVGQSKNVVVENSRAEKNVAGIEIENTDDADVHDNIATGNTGGILVFNMPNLAQRGARTRVFHNKVADNNHKNFGLAGSAVSSVPAGAGIVVNSNDQVEIFDNDITGNKTANIIVASVFSSGLSREGMTSAFDPYPESIYIYGNRMSGGGGSPDNLKLQALRIAMFGPTGALPDVLWDGYQNPDKLQNGMLPDDLKLCVQNDGAEVLNVDAPDDYKDPKIETAAHDCALPKLPAVKLDGKLAHAE